MKLLILTITLGPGPFLSLILILTLMMTLKLFILTKTFYLDLVPDPDDEPIILIMIKLLKGLARFIAHDHVNIVWRVMMKGDEVVWQHLLLIMMTMLMTMMMTRWTFYSWLWWQWWWPGEQWWGRLSSVATSLLSINWPWPQRNCAKRLDWGAGVTAFSITFS